MKPSTATLSVTAALALLVAGTYLMVVRPADQRRDALQRDINQKQASLADFDRTTASLRAISAKVDELRPAVILFESRFTPSHEMDKILAEISFLAETNSLQTKTIKTPADHQTDQYREQEMELSLTGNFGGFYQFLLQLEDMQRITRIKKINLTKASDGQMQVDLTIGFYSQPQHDAM
jgi:Tfp pilus assembly protein PilO